MNATRKCSFISCERSTRIVRGLCTKHYQEMRASGALDAFPVRSFMDRFNSRLFHAPTGCIEWLGSLSPTGYGTIWVDGKHTRVHRLAWTISNGEIPDGMVVCHTCDNPKCCNIDHLFIGTHQENMDDMTAKGRGRNGNVNGKKTHCKRGHPFDLQNTYQCSNGNRACITCRKAYPAERYMQQHNTVRKTR